jgi:hypothetical protein
MVVPTGCGGGKPEEGVIEYRRVRSMTDFYAAYVAAQRGQAPPSEQAFRQYLATKQDQLNAVGLTVDEMFVSPRRTGPLIWIYGTPPPSGPMGTYFA